MEQGFGGLIGIIIADATWAIFGLILIAIGSVTPARMTEGSFLELSTVIGWWITIGAVLGIGTVVAIMMVVYGAFQSVR